MFEQAKAKARALATTALAHGIVNQLYSNDKDGGVWSPKAIAKSVGTQGATMLAVEAVTGSLFFGLGTAILTDIGRCQVEGHLHGKELTANRDYAEQQYAQAQAHCEAAEQFGEFIPRENDPFETACEIPDSHTYRGA